MSDVVTDLKQFSVSRVTLGLILSVAMIAPSPSTSATSLSRARPSAICWPQDKVIGIGQNNPSAIAIPVQTPRQSAAPMKPVSGV